MKTEYFTETDIDIKSNELFEELGKNVQVEHWKFQPAKSCLIIIDMQKYFLSEESHAFIPAAIPIIRKIKSLADIYHKMNYPVVVTKHINTKENAGLMSKWWNELLTAENELSEVINTFQNEKSITIEKSQYDAFYKTELENILLKNNIKQLIITGVVTHQCCETTARNAFVRGFEVFFPIDCTATYNKQHHFSSMLNLSRGFAQIVKSNQIISELI